MSFARKLRRALFHQKTPKRKVHAHKVVGKAIAAAHAPYFWSTAIESHGIHAWSAMTLLGLSIAVLLLGNVDGE